MPEPLADLLCFLAADPAYHVVWVGTTVAIVRRKGSAEWRSLGSIGELYAWEMERLEWFARAPKRADVRRAALSLVLALGACALVFLAVSALTALGVP